jgi:hypothetical protein
MPDGGPYLDDKEIELVRQWILFGAPETGVVIDTNLIADYYDNFGISSMPVPPAPPAPGDGFQIHFGPYFLAPGEEAEYLGKYDTQLPTTTEIKRMDTHMGDYSHHFITYRYLYPQFSNKPYGLRPLDDADFAYVDLVNVNQFSDSLVLPEGTAFRWTTNTVLDLNSHYINYSNTNTLSCEVYLNVLTQPNGTAAQIMNTSLQAYTNLWVPNNGNEYTFTEPLWENSNDEVFIWGITSHTHQWGVDYDVYKRNIDGSRGEHLFDASCLDTDGIPGCGSEIYDHQHPPIRYDVPFIPIKANEGLIHEAKFVNNGPAPVTFGFTSSDEMMVLIYFYTDDTAGLNQNPITSIENPQSSSPYVNVYPNPADEVAIMEVENLHGALSLELYDVFGKKVFALSNATPQGQTTNRIEIKREGLAGGVYLYKLKNSEGMEYSGKMIFR